MTVQYTPLIKLALIHPYFGSEGCPTLKLIPTNTTVQVMDSLVIRAVERNYGIELFSGFRNGQPIGLATIDTDEVACLSFILRATDPAFINYTDLYKPSAELTPEPRQKGEEDLFSHLAYLTNLKGNELPVTADRREPILSPTETIIFDSSEEVDPTRVSLNDGYGNLIATGPRDETDKTIVVSKVKEQDSENERTVIHLDLQKFPAGLFQLLIDGNVNKTFITNHDGLKQGDIGLLSVYLEKGEGGRKDLTISFTNRATYWRYYIIDGSDSSSNYSISNDDGSKAPFRLATEEHVLPNGDSAKVLLSHTLLFLQRHYPTNYKLNMTRSMDGHESKISISLPNADANRINYKKITDTESIEKHHYFSDIYVYI